MSTAAVTIKSEAAIGAALAGEGMSGFEELYRRHYERVYWICLRMTGSIQKAEDLAQEVFIVLHEKLPSFRGEAAFTTWLHRLTVNQVLMHFRKRAVKADKVTTYGDIPERSERSQVVARIGLEAAIAQLAPGYRTVFVLHDVEGFEHEEIGQMLGIHAGTSKSQLAKARAKLRLLLTAN